MKRDCIIVFCLAPLGRRCLLVSCRRVSPSPYFDSVSSIRRFVELCLVQLAKYRNAQAQAQASELAQEAILESDAWLDGRLTYGRELESARLSTTTDEGLF
eukprot:scaffold6488_cov250-Isochrysis_galbana.AAC.2